MSKKHAPQAAKYFKYKFTITMTLLIVAVLLLSLAGIGVSSYRIWKNGIHGLNDVLKDPLLILVCLFLIAIVLGILIKSQYVITETHYVTQFGFIRSKFLIKDVTAVTLDMNTKKLTVNVGEQYTVLSLSPEWHNDFIQALLAVNPKIKYDVTLTDADNKPKKKKK